MKTGFIIVDGGYIELTNIYASELSAEKIIEVCEAFDCRFYDIADTVDDRERIMEHMNLINTIAGYRLGLDDSLCMDLWDNLKIMTGDGYSGRGMADGGIVTAEYIKYLSDDEW